MIKQEQLDKCILTFWLCVKENEAYVSVSPSSLSSVITESKIYIGFSLYEYFFFRKKNKKLFLSCCIDYKRKMKHTLP
jgi:hypothetical protein